MLKSLHQIGNRFLAFLLALSLAVMPLSPVSLVSPALAQSTNQVTDTEAPVLIHRQLESGTAGELQTFLARVSDDFGIRDVILYYRQSDSGQFQSLSMRPIIDSIGEYMIAVETTDGAYAGLQYYIEAIDLEGNRTNRGFDYAPIVLPLTAPVTETLDTPAVAVAEPPEPEPVPQSEGFSVNPVTILLGVGALLALGALAAGGGDDDSPSTVTPGTTTPDTVTLTVISDVPSAE